MADFAWQKYRKKNPLYLAAQLDKAQDIEVGPEGQSQVIHAKKGDYVLPDPLNGGVAGVMDAATFADNYDPEPVPEPRGRKLPVANEPPAPLPPSEDLPMSPTAIPPTPPLVFDIPQVPQENG